MTTISIGSGGAAPFRFTLDAGVGGGVSASKMLAAGSTTSSAVLEDEFESDNIEAFDKLMVTLSIVFCSFVDFGGGGGAVVFGFWTIQVDFGAPARTAGWFL